MFNKVKQFEQEIATFFGSPYAVAVDCATHGIELSLRLTQPTTVTCPRNTYLSIPMTFCKLGYKPYDWFFNYQNWQEYYYISGKVIDAAVLWRPNSYIKDTLMSISFQYKKHLNLTRGGMILCETIEEYSVLKAMSYDGRDLSIVPWHNQDIASIGYHYYMTPEIAELGLVKLPAAIESTAKIGSYLDYPDISQMSIFSNVTLDPDRASWI